MKENRTLVIAMSFAALIIMSVAYAAFANVITITANSTAAGMGSITTKVTCPGGTAGITGATVPVATDINGGTDGNVILSATLYQPGDTAGCTITWKNETPFTVKTVSGVTGCSNVTGAVSKPVDIRVTNKVAAGATLAPGSSTSTTVTFSYFSTTTQGQPTTLTASIACALVWIQA